MKKTLFALLLVVILSVLVVTPAMAKDGQKNSGVTIQDGILTYAAEHYLTGQPLKVGYDIFGYNYQAYMYKGSYANIYLGAAGFPPYEGDTEAYLTENPGAASHWAWPYRDVNVSMKWNDAWLSNMDRDGDGKLDRHYGYPSYIGSGAWETNHQSGEYDGYKWNYFCKIVAAPANAVKSGGIWYTADGTEIGPAIWGEFATIQEVNNDQGTGDHGIAYNGPAPSGFGYYAP
jgi:hypothetical protein